MSKNKILNKFDHRLQYINPQIVNTLTEIDEIKGEFKAGFKMTPQAITNLKKSTLITSTGASTRIEGSKLSDKEIEKIMRGLTISKFANRDFQEVQGYLEVLQNIFNDHQNLTLKESLITSLHNQLLKYSTKDDTHRGAYKKKEKTEDILSPKQYEVWQYLISTNKGVGPSEIVKATGIALGTVRQALNRLLELGKVKRIGRGRGTRYIQTLNY